MADIIVNQTVQTFDVKVKYSGFSFNVNRTIFINNGIGQSQSTTEIDGGTPDSVYLIDQFIDGGDITV